LASASNVQHLTISVVVEAVALILCRAIIKHTLTHTHIAINYLIILNTKKNKIQSKYKIRITGRSKDQALLQIFVKEFVML